MNKNYFMNMFPNEDEYLIATLWEDMILCLDISYPVYGNIFLPPQIWTKIIKYLESSNLKCFAYGVTENSEKKLLIFSPKDFEEKDLEQNLVYFKIDCSNKFKELQHKDFLGGVMGLGIKRETFGDIIIKNNIGYSITSKEIYEIILENLEYINTLPSKVELVSEDIIPKIEFKEQIITISSLRLDTIIAAILNISRNKSIELIESGKILNDYSVEKNKNKKINEETTITIRGKGKFILSQVLGENKKNKLKILVKEYK